MKLKVLSIILIASLLASILMIGMIGTGNAEYLVGLKGPMITIKLPNGTQDMNVSGTHPYAIGDTFNVTVWINNVTGLDGFGLTAFWNSSLMVMTAFTLSPLMTACKLNGTWTWSPVRGPGYPGYPYGSEWTNNATLISGKPWTGLIPLNIGAILGIGAGTASDALPLSGNVEICILTFQIKMFGVHWWYIDKDPANYGNNPGTWPMDYLSLEAAFVAVHFPYCLVELAPGATVSNYGVAWSVNPYFAPPAAYVQNLNAVLITMPPSPYGASATTTFTNFPFVHTTIPITVTQSSPGFNGFTLCPITSVKINYGDGSPTNTTSTSGSPPSVVFNHAWNISGIYTIQTDCYAAGLAAFGPLAWYNKTYQITVLAAVSTGIDVYEVREPLYPGDTYSTSGKGAGIPGRPYDPQALVQLEAYLQYNSEPVLEKIVCFQINVTQGPAKGQCILYRTCLTNDSGYADIWFRIPDLSAGYGGPNYLFGNWTVFVTTSMCQVTYGDNMTFTMGYILTLKNMAAVNSPVKRLQYINFTVSVTNIDWVTVKATMILVVYDNNEVPIGQVLVTIYVPGPITLGSLTTTYYIGLTIPKYAYVGASMGYINLLTGLPALGGLAFCPEVSASFLST
jgi:hypothetical protein